MQQSIWCLELDWFTFTYGMPRESATAKNNNAKKPSRPSGILNSYPSFVYFFPTYDPKLCMASFDLLCVTSTPMTDGQQPFAISDQISVSVMLPVLVLLPLQLYLGLCHALSMQTASAVNLHWCVHTRTLFFLTLTVHHWYRRIETSSIMSGISFFF